MIRKALMLGACVVAGSIVACAAPSEDEEASASVDAVAAKICDGNGNLRAAPSTSAQIVGSVGIPAGSNDQTLDDIGIYCQTTGDDVRGSTRWIGVRLREGFALRYMHDSTLDCGTFSLANLPACPQPNGGSSSSSSSGGTTGGGSDAGDAGDAGLTAAASTDPIEVLGSGGSFTHKKWVSAPGATQAKPVWVWVDVVAKDSQNRIVKTWSTYETPVRFLGSADATSYGSAYGATKFYVTYNASEGGSF